MADLQEPAQNAEDTFTPESYAKEWLAYAEMDLAIAEPSFTALNTSSCGK